MHLVITIRDIRSIPSAPAHTAKSMTDSAAGAQGKKTIQFC